MKVVKKFSFFVFICCFVLQTSGASHFANAKQLTSPLNPIFQPTVLAGITINPEDPLQLDFLIAEGDDVNTSQLSSKEIAEKISYYFLTALTVPEQDLWVNLSPYEENRVIPEHLGKTELGHTLLAQDYLLKQFTASLLNPESETGKKFWERVYERSNEQVNSTDVPFNAFHKVWITPETAVVATKGNSIFVLESALTVQLEEDLNLQEFIGLDQQETILSSETKQILREIILPEIKKEINHSEQFAPLRQIYHSVILAKWYKQTLQESLLGRVYTDQKRMNGIDQVDAEKNKEIYQHYLAAFESGATNVVRQEFDPEQQQVVEKHFFTGGIEFDNGMIAQQVRDVLAAIKDRYGDAVSVLKTTLAGPENREVIMALIKKNASRFTWRAKQAVSAFAVLGMLFAAPILCPACAGVDSGEQLRAEYSLPQITDPFNGQAAIDVPLADENTHQEIEYVNENDVTEGVVFANHTYIFDEPIDLVQFHESGVLQANIDPALMHGLDFVADETEVGIQLILGEEDPTSSSLKRVPDKHIVSSSIVSLGNAFAVEVPVSHYVRLKDKEWRAAWEASNGKDVPSLKIIGLKVPTGYISKLMPEVRRIFPYNDGDDWYLHRGHELNNQNIRKEFPGLEIVPPGATPESYTNKGFADKSFITSVQVVDTSRRGFRNPRRATTMDLATLETEEVEIDTQMNANVENGIAQNGGVLLNFDQIPLEQNTELKSAIQFQKFPVTEYKIDGLELEVLSYQSFKVDQI